MVYRHFRIQCAVRILLMLATTLLFFYLLFRSSLLATTIIVGAAILLQALALIRFVEQTNRFLSRFLDAIRYSDFSQSFTSPSGGRSFAELNAAFSEVIDKFRATRAETEEQYRYLQTVIQHVGIGLISYKPDGDIELINSAAKRLLHVTRLDNIRALKPLSEKLVQTLERLKAGDRALVKVTRDGEESQLVVYATELRLRQRALTLVSIQNIQAELAEQEMEAWQKLVRVLTHEIMNSITPVVSLTGTVQDLLKPQEGMDDEKSEQTVSAETIHDVKDGLKTIQKRSQGLLHFVDAYRNLARVPKPQFQLVKARDLIDRLQHLLEAQPEFKAIQLKIEIDPEDLELAADPGLIEQVMINLLLNAAHAVKSCESPVVELIARMDEKTRAIIQVADNGPGIFDEALEKIFIPFYTTKPEGSGIGLALSRQIMRLHRGSLTVQSTPNERTVFTMRF